MEEWRVIPGELYEVSTSGVIRRAVDTCGTRAGRIVKPIAGATGYAQVSLCAPKRSPRRAYVHRLVLEAFVGPCPDGHVVNHRDGDKQNNALANLEYVTRAQNARHAIETGLRPLRAMHVFPKPPPRLQRGEEHWTNRMPDRIARGDRMPHTKLTAAKVREMREMRARGETLRVISEKVGICIAQCSRVLRGQRWSYVQ